MFEFFCFFWFTTLIHKVKVFSDELVFQTRLEFTIIIYSSFTSFNINFGNFYSIRPCWKERKMRQRRGNYFRMRLWVLFFLSFLFFSALFYCRVSIFISRFRTLHPYTVFLRKFSDAQYVESIFFYFDFAHRTFGRMGGWQVRLSLLNIGLFVLFALILWKSLFSSHPNFELGNLNFKFSYRSASLLLKRLNLIEDKRKLLIFKKNSS